MNDSPVQADGNAPEHHSADPARLPDLPRYIAGGALIVLVIIIIRAREHALWFFLLLPLAAGLLFPALANERFTSTAEGIGTFLEMRRRRATEATGKFARFVRRPAWRLLKGVWHTGSTINSPHAQRGAQVSATLYTVAALTGGLILIAVFVFYLVAALLVLAVVCWLVTYFLGGGHASTGKVAYRVVKKTGLLEKGSATIKNQFAEKVGTLHASRDFFGNPVVTKRNVDGTVAATIREEPGIAREAAVVARDVHGEMIARSEFHDEILTNGRMIHKDVQGRIIGYSRTTDGIFGEVTEHFDAQGNKTGETRPDQ